MIDLWDARTQKLIWRGTTSGTVPSNSEKLAAQVERAIDQMVDKWRKLKKKAEKEKKKAAKG